MSQTNKFEKLQFASAALGVAAVVVYLLGFVVISVFDGSYGIADFSLFRTKAIAAGTLFSALAALGVVITFRTFHFFGFRPERAASNGHVATPKNQDFVILDVALAIPYTCMALTVPAYFLFVAPPPLIQSDKFLVCLIPVAVTSALSTWGKRWFAENPLSFIGISVLNCLIFFGLVRKYGNAAVFWFTVWLSFVCWLTLYVTLKFVKREDHKGTEWERLILTALPLIFGVYAIKVYPNLSHQFGGGSPVQAIFHLNKKLPSFESENVSAMLLDETEQGFYLVRSSDKSSFLARSVVDSVDFVRNQAPQAALAPVQLGSAIPLKQESAPMNPVSISGSWEKFVSTSAAFLTPLIALIAAWIAYQQHSTQRRQLKLSLFDRRWKVFDAARRLIGAAIIKANVAQEELRTFLIETSGAEFLFGSEILAFNKSIYDNAVELEMLRAQGAQDAERLRVVLQFFGGKTEEATKLYSKYMAFAAPN
jgi:hypothetical protein